MLLLPDVGFGLLIQQCRERLLIFGVHRRVGQFTNHLVGEVGASPPAYRPLRGRSAGKGVEAAVKRLPWRRSFFF